MAKAMLQCLRLSIAMGEVQTEQPPSQQRRYARLAQVWAARSVDRPFIATSIGALFGLYVHRFVLERLYVRVAHNSSVAKLCPWVMSSAGSSLHEVARFYYIEGLRLNPKPCFTLNPTLPIWGPIGYQHKHADNDMK